MVLKDRIAANPTSKTMLAITVGILTFNRKKSLLTAIESVYSQNYPLFEIVVVDNNSSDGTVEEVRSKFPNVKLISLPTNLGCPGGRNVVYVNATGDLIVNLDDDAYLSANSLSNIANVFEADPEIGIVSMGVRFIDQPQVVDNEFTCVEVGTFRGTASVIRRSMIQTIGLYPDHFFMMDEEDHLSIRALNANYKIVHCQMIYVWHPLHDGTGSKRMDYYRFRNPILLVLELFPARLAVKYTVLKACSHLVYSIRRGCLLKYLYGLLYIVIHLPGILYNKRSCSEAAVLKYLSLRHLISTNYGKK